MLRFPILVNTDQDEYILFIIDYNTDTINPENEGVYMLEIIRAADENLDSLPSWQERMRAGISIH